MRQVHDLVILYVPATNRITRSWNRGVTPHVTTPRPRTPPAWAGSARRRADPAHAGGVRGLGVVTCGVTPLFHDLVILFVAGTYRITRSWTWRIRNDDHGPGNRERAAADERLGPNPDHPAHVHRRLGRGERGPRHPAGGSRQPGRRVSGPGRPDRGRCGQFAPLRQCICG